MDFERNPEFYFPNFSGKRLHCFKKTMLIFNGQEFMQRVSRLGGGV